MSEKELQDLVTREYEKLTVENRLGVETFLAMKRERDEAVALLRRFDVAVTENVNEPVFDACGPFGNVLDALNHFLARISK